MLLGEMPGPVTINEVHYKPPVYREAEMNSASTVSTMDETRMEENWWDTS